MKTENETEIIFAFENTKSIFFICCADVSMAGLKLQTCEEPGANVKFKERQICEEQEASGEEREFCSTKQKSRLSGTGGQQRSPGESNGKIESTLS